MCSQFFFCSVFTRRKTPYESQYKISGRPCCPRIISATTCCNRHPYGHLRSPHANLHNCIEVTLCPSAIPAMSTTRRQKPTNAPKSKQSKHVRHTTTCDLCTGLIGSLFSVWTPVGEFAVVCHVMLLMGSAAGIAEAYSVRSRVFSVSLSNGEV